MTVWNHCTAQLKRELTVAEFNTWILPLQASEDSATLHLFAPNRFVLEWIESHYKDKLVALCRELTNHRLNAVHLHVGSPRPVAAHGTRNQDTPEATRGFPHSTQLGANAGFAATSSHMEPGLDDPLPANLNPDFTFDTFVEGKSNQIARAASLQIGGSPGTSYNPLFIYGGVGLGKTHLMHAVGNMIVATNPNARVSYLHSERFVADMIRALQHNRMYDFKKRHRSLNALLIDDVQFFAGKERSQEEFFHTFNALFESKQQIILTSDRFPKDVPGLEERLRSRFGWGLTVAIDPPDLETRVAILHSKAGVFGRSLPEDVGFFVAKRIRSNIRDLEGALRRLIANSEFTGQEITLDFAKSALRDMLVAQDKQVTIENIQKVVAEYYKIRGVDLVSAKRTRTISRPRQVAMTLAKELTKHSLPEIGNAFGGRDHTTVLHATRKVRSLRESEPTVEEDYRNLLRILTS